MFSYLSMKFVVRPAAHPDDILSKYSKKTVISYTEPLEHHEEPSESPEMDQDDKFFLIFNQPLLDC